MKLEKFKTESPKKKAMIIGSILLVLFVTIVVIYRSFTFFESSQEFNVIKGSVPDQNYDLMLSFQIEENGSIRVSDTIPTDKNYEESMICNNGASGVWNYEEWGPIIKPNVYSWRNIQPVNAHLNSYNYKRKMDSHMMKNTEWGAVAYLQHSIYGLRQSVRINNNNNSGYITGYSAVSEPTCGYTADNQDCNRYEGTNLNVDGEYTKRYNTEEGYLASTTKNITGVYDTSGGASEYMMA